MPSSQGLLPRTGLELSGYDYPGQVTKPVQNLPRSSLLSQNDDNTQHGNLRWQNEDTTLSKGTSESEDEEFSGYDYPSQVTVTHPAQPLPRPPLPSLPSGNEEDTQYLSLR